MDDEIRRRATRQDFPRPMGEGEAFRRFVESRLSVRLSVEFRREQVPIETVFYKWSRCELVYQGELPVDIALKEDTQLGELSVWASGAPSYPLLVSPGWFDQLLGWAVS